MRVTLIVHTRLRTHSRPHRTDYSQTLYPASQAFTLSSSASKVQLSAQDLKSGFLPNGLFTRLVGRAVQWAQGTSNVSVENFGLYADVAVLSFGSQSFRIQMLPDLHAVKVDVDGASPLAVLRRVEQIVSQVCADCMGSLKYTVALALDDTFEEGSGATGGGHEKLLVPLQIVQHSVTSGVKIIGKLNKTLCSAADAKTRFQAFVPNRDLLDSYDVFLSYRQATEGQAQEGGDNKLSDKLFDLAVNFAVGSKNREMRVYLDAERMQAGRNLAVQASQAVSASLIFVPLVSNTTLERMYRHDPSMVDWVLFEAVVALESLKSPNSRLERVFAVWRAAPDSLNRLPATIPTATLEQAGVELRALGVLSPQSELPQYTVKGIVETLKSNINYVPSSEVSDDDVAAEAIEKIVETLHECDVDSCVNMTPRLIANIQHHQQAGAGVSWESGQKIRHFLQDLVEGDFCDYYPEVVITYATGKRDGVDADGSGLGLLYTRLVAQGLHSHGISSFSLAHVPVGTNRTLLIDKMTAAKALVVIHTPDLFESQACLYEIMAAFDQSLTVFPLTFESAVGKWHIKVGSLEQGADTASNEGPEVMPTCCKHQTRPLSNT